MRSRSAPALDRRGFWHPRRQRSTRADSNSGVIIRPAWARLHFAQKRLSHKREGKTIGRTYRRYVRIIESQDPSRFQAGSSATASTTPNTKVLPIPSSDCFRAALLLVSVRRNRRTSAHPRKLSVRRCFDDGYSEHAGSGTSAGAKIKPGTSCPPPERVCPAGCRSPPAPGVSEILHDRVGAAFSCRCGAHTNSGLEFLGGRTN